MRWQALALMLVINMANLVSNCFYSIMDAFFPQEAETKLLSPVTIGAIFSAFPAVVFFFAPIAMVLMGTWGTRCVFTTGIGVLSAGTLSLAAAPALPDGTAFAIFCMSMRVIQGAGSALEEASAYVLVAGLAGPRVSLYLGMTELSTGLGYMLGPPIGGVLFSLFAFEGPFIASSSILLLTAIVTSVSFGILDRKDRGLKDSLDSSVEVKVIPAVKCSPTSDTEVMADTTLLVGNGCDAGDGHGAGEGCGAIVAADNEWGLWKLICEPQILLVAIAAAIANSDYAFLEPIMGDYAL